MHFVRYIYIFIAYIYYLFNQSYYPCKTARLYYIFQIGGKVPQDRTVIRRVLRTLSIPLLICMWVITTIGILGAVSLIVFNVLNHHRRYVPNKNQLVVPTSIKYNIVYNNTYLMDIDEYYSLFIDNIFSGLLLNHIRLAIQLCCPAAY